MSAARLIVFLAAVALSAQDFRSTVTGTVTDPAGSAVAGAKVKAVNTQTNASTEVVSNDSGRYSMSFLIPGQYVVTVEATGFKQYVRRNVELQISTSVGLNVRLELGALTGPVKRGLHHASAIGVLRADG